MRITRPLMGAAVGAGALGATLALGLTMASAATGGSAGSTASHSPAATAASVKVAASPSPGRPLAHPGSRHKCPAGSRGHVSPGQPDARWRARQHGRWALTVQYGRR